MLQWLVNALEIKFLLIILMSESMCEATQLKKIKMNSWFFSTFSPSYMKENMPGWEVKIHTPFHVSFPSCKMCVFRHLGRCLTTLCSHQVRDLYKKSCDYASWDDVNMCGWNELQETGKKLFTHLQSLAPSLWLKKQAKWNTRTQRKLNAFCLARV